MGGGVMRTAAKTAVLGGYRSAGRMLPRPATATVTAAAPEGEAGQSISFVSSERTHPDAALTSAIQRPTWEIDEWEFAGGKEDLFDALHPAPRVVFGPVPTLEEAKEATSDLKDALEKVYLSNAAEGHVKSNQESQDLNTCENSQISSAVPKHVVQAFSLLGSPDAQNVVASLASDRNVWDAILNNHKVMEFCKTHQPDLHHETNLDPEESVAENLSDKESVGNCRAAREETSESLAFSGWMHNIKQKVSDMVSNISGLVQDFIGTSTQQQATNTKTSTHTTTTDDSYLDVAKGLMALAVAAILVVLLKRGG